MSIANIHFIRQVLVTDFDGQAIPTMQSSESNADCLNPIFRAVATYDHAKVSALYRELGGGRNEGELVGSIVIIPNRSGWASLWKITPAEVRVVPNMAFQELSAEARNLRLDRARARDHLMRD